MNSLSERQAQQLSISLNGRRIREIALTVCTIQPLALEVKSILDDLYGGSFTFSPTEARQNGQLLSQHLVGMADADQHASLLPASTGNSLAGRSRAKSRARHFKCTLCSKPAYFLSHSLLVKHKSCFHHRPATSSVNPEPVRASSVTSEQNEPSSSTNQNNVAKDSETSDVETVARLEDRRSTETPHTGSSTSPLGAPPLFTESEQTNVIQNMLDEMKVEPMSHAGENVGISHSSSSALPSSTSILNHSLPLWPASDSNMSDDGVRGVTSPPTSSRPSATPTLSDGAPEVLNCEQQPFNSGTLQSFNTNQPSDAISLLLSPSRGSMDGIFGCPQCDFMARSREAMQRHVSTSHSIKKTYSCANCSYSTNKKWLLTRHHLVHTGVKPHKCPVCSFGCIDHIILVRHMESKHPGIKPHTCTVCGEHTYTKTLLRRHEKEAHYGRIPGQALPKTSSASSRGPSIVPDNSALGNVAPSLSSFAWGGGGAPMFPPRL